MLPTTYVNACGHLISRQPRPPRRKLLANAVIASVGLGFSSRAILGIETVLIMRIIRTVTTEQRENCQ